MMHIHASRLPTVGLCPASYAHGEMIDSLIEEDDAPDEDTDVEERQAASRRGTKLHEIIKKGEIPNDLSAQDHLEVTRAAAFLEDAIRKLALRAGVQPEEIKVYQEVRMSFSFGSVLLEGTADVILYEPRSKLAVVIDWKFLNLDHPLDNYIAQCEGYMFLGAHMLDVAGIEAFVVNCRTAMATRRAVPEGEIEGFKAQFQIQLQILDQQVSKPNPSVIPGPWQCKYCPRRHECPELRKEVALAIQKSRVWSLQSDEDALHWAEQAELAKEMAKAVQQNVAAYVLARGGNVRGLKVQNVAGHWVADDVEEIYSRVSDSITFDEFKSMMRLSVATLRDQWVEKNGERFKFKKRDAIEGFFRLLEGTLSRKKGFQQLRRTSK